MQQLATKLIFIVNIVGHSTSTSAGQYKSYWVKNENWNKISDKPSNAKTYGKSVELCSLACREDFSDDSTEACEAFAISDQGECEFGTIKANNCLRILNENEAGAIKVFADTKIYTMSRVYELQMVNHDEEPVTHIQTMPRTLGCSDTVKIPRTSVNYKVANPPCVFNHNHGLMSCGGVDLDSGSSIRECKYWKPGQIGWENKAGLEDDHDVGACATSLGPNEAFILGKKDASNVAEILSNNEWNIIKEFPYDVKYCFAFAKTPNVVYVMGGWTSAPTNNKAQTYKYERNTNSWVKLPDLIYGTIEMSCARAGYNGRDTILCVGGSLPDSKGKTQYFDLNTETWYGEEEQFIGMEILPAHTTKTIVAIGNYFYRATESELYVWNLETGDWTKEPEPSPRIGGDTPAFQALLPVKVVKRQQT